jgi:hypothetical protein
MKNVSNNPGLSGYRRSITFSLLLLALTAALPGLRAQVGQTLFFMDRLPQSSLFNPAVRHHHNFHIGLPVISSFNVNAGTNFASFSDIIFRHPVYDSLISFLHPDADIQDFTGILRDWNTFNPDIHINILSFGFRAGSSFFSFNVTERATLRIMLPGDFILLGLEGNEQFIGRETQLSGLGAEMNYFREYSAGYSRQVNERLSLGVRGKLLFGKAGLSLRDTGLGLHTDPGNYSTRLRSEFALDFSMPLTLLKDDDGAINKIHPHFDARGYDPLDFIFNTGNAGFAVDMGLSWRIIAPVTVFASVTDLGYINWKDDVYNLRVNGDYEFDGIDIYPLFTSKESETGENILDSLIDNFRIRDSRNSFSRALPARIYLGGSLELQPGLSLGLLGRSEFGLAGLEQAVTLSANSNIGRWLSASVSYSVMDNSYNNFGTGLAIRGGGCQFFMVTDNINTIFIPHRTRGVNLWFGLNILFGHREGCTHE